MNAMLVIAMLLLVAASMSGCLKDDDDDGNGNGGDGGEVLANAGEDLIGQVGVPVTFNGSASSGKIEKYWWDVDSANASEPLTEDLVGMAVEHTYTAAGVYTVTLTVEGKKDKQSNDTLVVRIDLIEEVTGSLAKGIVNDTYEYTVTGDIQKVMLTLTYPTTLVSFPSPFIVLLDMWVYVGDDQLVINSVGQIDPGDTQTDELDVPLAELITNGGFTLQVRGNGLPETSEQYTLDVELYYHSV